MKPMTYETCDYYYNGYGVTKDGRFFNEKDVEINWDKDNEHIRLRINGSQKYCNGLKILFLLFNALNEEECEKCRNSSYNVVLKDKRKGKTKDNLVLERRTYTSKKILTDEMVEEIKKEYGLKYLGFDNEKRKRFVNQNSHQTSYRKLAQKYGVSLYTIESVVQGHYGNKKLYRERQARKKEELEKVALA